MSKDTLTSNHSPAVAHPADDYNGRGEDHRGDVGGTGGAESWVLDGTHNEMEREFRDAAAQNERTEMGSVITCREADRSMNRYRYPSTLGCQGH